MTATLKTLLDLRREAEQAARVRLAEAITARVEAEEAHAGLVEARRVARAARLREERHGARALKTAAEAQTRARYHQQLVEADTAAALDVEEHLEVAFNPALGAEGAAREAYEAARVALEAASKLQEREAAAAAKQAEHRAEAAAADHTNATFVRRRGDV
jgi:hypothetical protein